ncbi:unnamed protein product [Phaeothamnion confervicola]
MTSATAIATTRLATLTKETAIATTPTPSPAAARVMGTAMWLSDAQAPRTSRRASTTIPRRHRRRGDRRRGSPRGALHRRRRNRQRNRRRGAPRLSPRLLRPRGGQLPSPPVARPITTEHAT